MATHHRPRIAILASGGGSTAEAFIRATQGGAVDADVRLVICSKPRGEAGVYERIDKLNKHYKLGIVAVEISGTTHPKGKALRGQTDAESEAICEQLAHSKIDHVALMGYMRMVRGALIQEYGWLPSYSSIYQARMSNTHPGPLPETADTYGLGTSRRVLQLGLAASKHTVHLVSAGIDQGPIIAQHLVEIVPGDSADDLFQRVQEVEKRQLPGALNAFLIKQREYHGTT